MNNKMKKRTITGVAIISGAILFSVGVAGTVHLINENNAIEAKTYVTAKENNFNTSPTPVIKEVNGITYSLNTTDYTATVTAINKPKSGSKVIGSAGTSNGVYDTLYVNIPQSITVDSLTYTIRHVGNNSNIFNSSLESYCENLKEKNIIIILPKTVSTVASNTFGVPSYLNTVYLISVSNTISIPNQNDGKLKVFGVPGSGAEAASPNFFGSLYSYDKNETTKTITLKGFSSNGKQFLEYLPSGVTVNFEMPTFISENNVKYTVTSIGSSAFAGSSFMKTLIIPGTVSKIGANAFKNCSNINWVKFLSKKISIDGYAFLSDQITEIYALPGSDAKTFWNNNHLAGNIGIQNSTFKALTVQSIDSVVQMPYRTSYNLGDTLDSRGIVLKLTMNNNPNGTLDCYVTPDSADLTFSPTTLSTAGTQAITVTYYDKTTTFNVDVKDTTPAPGPSTEEYEVKLYDSDKATVLSTLTLKDGYFYQDGNKIEKNGKFNLPTKDGYKFVSYRSYGDSQWILSDGTFGSEEQYNAVYNCIKNDYGTYSVYMYAEWEKIYDQLELEVYYDNTSGKKETIVLKDGAYYQGENRIEKDGKIKIPTKEGHKFLGYWGQDNDEHQWVNADGSFVGGEAQYDALWNYIKSYPDLAYMVARWAPITHTVHYDANGGEWRR